MPFRHQLICQTNGSNSQLSWLPTSMCPADQLRRSSGTPGTRLLPKLVHGTNPSLRLQYKTIKIDELGLHGFNYNVITLFDVVQCSVEKLSQSRSQFKRSIEILTRNEFDQFVVVCFGFFGFISGVPIESIFLDVGRILTKSEAHIIIIIIIRICNQLGMLLVTNCDLT